MAGRKSDRLSPSPCVEALATSHRRVILPASAMRNSRSYTGLYWRRCFIGALLLLYGLSPAAAAEQQTLSECVDDWVQLESEYARAMEAGDLSRLASLRARKAGLDRDCLKSEPGPGEGGPAAAGSDLPQPDTSSVGPSDVTITPRGPAPVPPPPPLGGETISPGFGTRITLVWESVVKRPGATFSTAWEAGATAAELGSEGIHPVVARYGNWVGEGWWGASTMPCQVGALPPTDPLDALGQEHDLCYDLADQAGEQYGEAEKCRQLSLCDENGYRAFQQLPHDPARWVPAPPDLGAARRFRDRFPITMQLLAYQHEQCRTKAPPPTPKQRAALVQRGPVNAADLRRMSRERIQSWNRDRGQRMRQEQANHSCPSQDVALPGPDGRPSPGPSSVGPSGVTNAPIGLE